MSETTCHWNGSGNPRVLRHRHLPGCLVTPRGPRLPRVNIGPNSFEPERPVDPDCRGCQTCAERHCLICGINHVDEQTCPGCVGATRDSLGEIVELCRGLRDQAAADSRDYRPEVDAVMGGDAMAALVSETTHGEYLPGDPLPPLAFLASWEDAWRVAFGHEAAGRATVRRASGYLYLHLSRAAQEHAAFDEFAAELRQIVGNLERILHAGEHDDTTATACFRDGCGGQLVRKVTDEGRSDEYECRRCSWRYDEAHYWLAVKQAYEAEAG